MKKFIKKIYLSLLMSLFVLCASVNTYNALNEISLSEHEINSITFEDEEKMDKPYTKF